MSAPQQPMPLQQAVQITSEVLSMMYKFFDESSVTTTYGNSDKNKEVLLSIKHCQLLMRPWIFMMQEEERLKKGAAMNAHVDYPGRDPSSALTKTN